MTHTILILQDEKSPQKQLKNLLLTNGYSVHVEHDGSIIAEYFKKNVPDLAIVDLKSAKQNEKICEEIKQWFHDLPVIILATNDEFSDQAKERNFSADDYLITPFLDEELITRIKIQLYKHEATETFFQVEDLTLDAKKLEVKRGKKDIQLTPQEFKLLHYLMINKEKILTRDMILSRIWMYSSEIETRVVDVYMGYLRKKIDGGFEKKLLHSVRGFGYVIKE